MNQQLKAYLVAFLKKSLLASIVFSLFMIASCNNNDKTKEQEEVEVPEAEKIIDKTYYLKLKAADIDSIFSQGGGNEIKQLYLKFIIKNKRYALEAYGTDSAGKKPTKSYPLEIISSKNPVNNPNGLTRNEQVITRGELKGFLYMSRSTNTPIPTGQFKDMYFKASIDQHPGHVGRKYMYFLYADELIKLDAASLTGGGYSNPSPPAVPCNLDCDN